MSYELKRYMVKFMCVMNKKAITMNDTVLAYNAQEAVDRVRFWNDHLKKVTIQTVWLETNDTWEIDDRWE